MIKIIEGSYSGSRYAVVGSEWFPFDNVEEATVFDYDADLGTYVNGVLGYDIDAFDALVAEHWNATLNNKGMCSLNEIANSIACEIEMLGGHYDVCDNCKL